MVLFQFRLQCSNIKQMGFRSVSVLYPGHRISFSYPIVPKIFLVYPSHVTCDIELTTHRVAEGKLIFSTEHCSGRTRAMLGLQDHPLSKMVTQVQAFVTKQEGGNT